MVDRKDADPTQSQSSEKSETSAPAPQPTKKKPSDFSFGRVLGEGSYSTVFYAVEDATGTEYAIKILNKNHIRREKKEHIVMREKKILASLNHPFFVRLRYTFQDEYSLYYVLTLAKGGELLEYIKALGKFNYTLTRFYSAEIFSAIDYLHSKNIIHRDIKPENILICDSLHIKITDFGTSKSLDESTTSNRTNSFVGTAQYASPELIKQSLADKSSDIWAIGCVIYQMATGHMAFHDSTTYLIFQKISKVEYTIPDDIHDDIRDIITKILIKEPEKRLGSLEQGGFTSVAAHPLFTDILWDKIHLCIPPEQMNTAYNDIQAKIKKNDSNDMKFEDETMVVPEANPTDKEVKTTIDLFQHRLKKHFLGSIIRSSKKVKVEEPAKVVNEEKDADESTWEDTFLGHRVLRKGILYKLRGIKPRKRMFLVTEGPNIFYFDPKTKELKGKVQWGKELRAYVVDEVSWCISIPGRIFNLEDRSRNSASWVEFITTLHEESFPYSSNS